MMAPRSSYSAFIAGRWEVKDKNCEVKRRHRRQIGSAGTPSHRHGVLAEREPRRATAQRLQRGRSSFEARWRERLRMTGRELRPLQAKALTRPRLRTRPRRRARRAALFRWR